MVRRGVLGLLLLCVPQILGGGDAKDRAPRRGESVRDSAVKPVDGHPSRPIRTASVSDRPGKAEELTRFRVVTSDGILVIYDTAIPPGGDSDNPGFVAYWSDFETQYLYVFDRLLFTPGDAAVAIRCLERDFVLDPALFASDNLGVSRISSIPPATILVLERSEGDDGSWQPASREGILTVMGFVAEEDGSGGVAMPPIPCWPVMLARAIEPLPRPPPGASPDDVLRLAVASAGCPPGGGPGPCACCPSGCTSCTSSDCDGDGIPNGSDPDVDGDGIPNGSDPDVDGDGIQNGSDPDVDGDGLGNGDDPDVDGDGLDNGDDPDVNGDGEPNGSDTDVNGDGESNGSDTDVEGDGLGNGDDPDVNGDGEPNGSDTDVNGDGESNGSDTDVNGDGESNGEDPDIDGDEQLNGEDPDMDGDGLGAGVDNDIDGDGIPNDDDPTPNGCEGACCGVNCVGCDQCDSTTGQCVAVCGGQCSATVPIGSEVPYQECPCTFGPDPGHGNCGHGQKCFRQDGAPTLLNEGTIEQVLQGSICCGNCPIGCPDNPPPLPLQCGTGLQGCYTSSVTFSISSQLSVGIGIVQGSLQAQLGFSDGEQVCLQGSCTASAGPCGWLRANSWIDIRQNRSVQLTHTWRFYDFFGPTPPGCTCVSLNNTCLQTGTSSATGSAGIVSHCVVSQSGNCPPNPCGP